VKSSKAQVQAKFHKIPRLRFEDRKLTSFSGVVVFMALFRALVIKERIRTCFRHIKSSGTYGFPVVIMMLVVHLLLGFRRIRSIDYYRDDILLRHVLGLKRKLPDVSTVTRNLGKADQQSVANLRRLIKEIFFERIIVQGFTRLTIDFDGTVVWTTGGGKEGTAAGFNKQKKGARGYYPLLCTCAQTGQVVDFLFRPGNVHDSNGAVDFIVENIAALKSLNQGIQVESRFDGAFFDKKLMAWLDLLHVEYTISVPFERLTELKGLIEARKRWRRINGDWSYFEMQWKPKSWDSKYRFIFVRHKVHKRRKDPVQLDLYEPRDHEHEYKVIVTTKTVSASKVLWFHNGRGGQEGIIGELKEGAQFDYIPFRKQVANELFMCTSILSHNLTRELQMSASPPRRGTTDRRAARWEFRKLATMRHEILLRAGRVTRPNNELTLTMNCNETVQEEIEIFMQALAD
jgi:hypothetical protein